MKKPTKYYREGYNNPGQFDQQKLLNRNDNISKEIIAGICQRKQDQINNCVKFK